jgi:hypothetical protein
VMVGFQISDCSRLGPATTSSSDWKKNNSKNPINKDSNVRIEL